ncbi:ATP-binding protein [Alkalihalobacterium sp. APHAB7]|uniref:ATP-binding protein n=1 Tax=Alkalihalobacterium sp. APHAB7 TaxID=3402081 RepID=UPI003AABCBD6
MVEQTENTTLDSESLTLQQLIKRLGEKGSHIIYMFNEYDKYIENALAYISEGIDNRDKILLIESQDVYTSITKKLIQMGYSEDDRQLIKYTTNTDFYRSEETFSAEKSIEQLSGLLKGNIERGVRTRIWGQVLASNSSICEIRLYENDCDHFFHGKNIVSVCAYNGLITPAFLQNELLKVHEYLMLDSQIEKSPFYNRNYMDRFSEFELEKLQKLEKENDLLKAKNEKLILNSARQKEREKYLKLEKMNAEKASREKSVFLSQMSHDLRTPLNTIQGYSQIMLMDEIDKNIRKKISKIYNASEHLLKLIEEILGFTVIDSGQINIQKEEIELIPFLENCIETILEISTPGINIQLEEIEDNVYIEADPFRLHQIITNLLNNAMKYSRPNGTIKIYCTLDKHTEDIKINIKDTGIGIENEELDLIFEPFYRSKNSMNNWEGTGLGLAIVAQLTKRMNGKYGVLAEEGKGSTFWVSFNRVKPNHYSDSEYKETQIGSISLQDTIKVLYVEDKQENIDVMTSMLHLIGNVNLHCVTSGCAGIEKAFELHPDIIMLDLSLPDIDGFEVLNKLKSNPITQNLPIIAVSADALETTIKKALLEGCTAYVTKPISMEEINRVIVKVMRT